MNRRDTEYLQKRRRAVKDQLKAQHSKPKAERDQREIQHLKQSISTLTRWLGDTAPEPEQKPAIVTKAEFREQFKAEFAIAEPQDIIQIPDVEALDKAWPAIVGKNIQIDGPIEVREEVRRRVREIVQKQKVDGFR